MGFELFCNLADCRFPVTDTGWVTRCLHVFCQDHGANFFANNHSRIQCPVCNEENLKEADILLCDANQSDLLLGGLTPEKSLGLLAKSIKLWKYQLEADRKFDTIKYQHVQTKMEETKRMCDTLLNEAKFSHANEIAALKTSYHELLIKLKHTTSELEMARIALKQNRGSSEREETRFPPVPDFSTDIPPRRPQNVFSPSLFSSRLGF